MMDDERIGLGLYRMTGGEISIIVPKAIRCGFRLFDTARAYNNAAFLAEAIGSDRASVFVQTKLGPKDHGTERAKLALEEQLGLFGYLDSVLVHWPGAHGLDPRDPLNAIKRRQTWAVLCEAHMIHPDRIRFIGVSNYCKRHLKEIRASGMPMPHVNQIEVSPAYWQKQTETIAFCREHGIEVQAYSVLAQGRILNDQRVLCIAEKHDATPAQVCIAWALAHDLVVLVKSSKEEHLLSNWHALSLDLSESDMNVLDNLGIEEKTCWDPHGVL